VIRLENPAALDGVDAFSAIAGPVRTLERSRLGTIGFSRASHERVNLTLGTGARRPFVIKRTRLSADWTACRSEDRRGREAAMLAEPALGPVWEVFACPYVAFAAQGDEIALVMEDLSPYLFPDVRQPVLEDQEERMLRALALLHARFWTWPGRPSPELALPWLTRPEHYAGLLDASCAADADSAAVLPDAMREQLTRGWAASLQRLPPAVTRVLTAPAAELGWLWDGLPRTLLHGDAKLANFALLPDGRVAAFDWALVGAGPPTVDVGWYLAVNASRLARSKEDALARYRGLLAEALGARLSDELWALLVRAGIVTGARMLLWSKALAVEADRPGALEEWAWWADQLAAVCAQGWQG
jgi:hypothetical protein